MAIRPYEQTVFSDAEKSACRSLLYRAMLDVLNLCQSRAKESLKLWNGTGSMDAAGWPVLLQTGCTTRHITLRASNLALI